MPIPKADGSTPRAASSTTPAKAPRPQAPAASPAAPAAAPTGWGQDAPSARPRVLPPPESVTGWVAANAERNRPPRRPFTEGSAVAVNPDTNDFSVRGAAVAVAPLTFGGRMTDVLREVSTLGLLPTRTFDGAFDTAHWQSAATVIALLGAPPGSEGRSLRTALASMGSTRATERFQQLVKDANPALAPAQVNEVASTLQRSVDNLYRQFDDADFRVLHGLLNSEALDPGDRSKLLAVITGPSRTTLDLLFDSPGFKGLPVEEQVVKTASFLAGVPTGVIHEAIGLGPVWTVPTLFSGLPQRPYRLEPMSTSTPDVRQYQLVIGERTIPMTVAAPQPGYVSYQPEELAKRLASLPDWTLKLVSAVNVPSGPNKSNDAYWAGVYGIPESAMSAGASCASGGLVNVYPGKAGPPAFTSRVADVLGVSENLVSGMFAHELGHEALRRATAKDPGFDQRWEQAIVADRQFVSNYATYNKSEDFSDTFSAYVSVRGTSKEQTYREHLPGRMKLLDEVYQQLSASPGAPR